jgi:hypothetical protein
MKRTRNVHTQRDGVSEDAIKIGAVEGLVCLVTPSVELCNCY